MSREAQGTRAAGKPLTREKEEQTGTST